MSSGEFTASPDLQTGPLPGEQLAVARESRGMTVAEIAQQLKLSPWQVEALEAGDHRRLPSSVFVRGFIRNYARLVKLDPSSLLRDMDAQTPSAAPVVTPVTRSSPAEIPYPTAKRVNWWPYAAVIAIAVGGLAAYEFYPDDVPAPPAAPSQAESPALQSQPQAQAQSVTETTPPREENVATVAAVVPAPAPAAVVPPESTAAPAKAPGIERTADRTSTATAPAAEVRRPAGEQVVRMHFMRESWVEIRDRNGRKIFSQLNAPGTDQTVSGLPPLSLIVGNANGVQLTHNEQPVDLARYIKVDVARLTLE